MAQVAAGILLYRKTEDDIKVLLLHPGGPYFRNKDKGSWTIPKGLAEPGETLQQTALRELTEETGLQATEGVELMELGSARMRSGKTIHAFALEWPLGDTIEIESNTFTAEWPPKSGQMQEFPEIDRAAIYSLEEAKEYIILRQGVFLERLEAAAG